MLGENRRGILEALRALRDDVTSQLGDIRNEVRSLREGGEKKYVTQAEFAPWKWAITLIVGGILTAAVAALMASIISP